MNRTSKNTLMIGGALILIALLLFCGPLTDRFGGGGQEIKGAPSVAAGPPDDMNDMNEVADAATVGALVGASGVESDVAGLDVSAVDDELPPVLIVAPAVVAVAAVAAVVATDTNANAGVPAGGTGGGEKLPSVSAGPPVSTPVAALASDSDGGAGDPATASRVFDDSVETVNGIGRAGGRFAPPVAAPGKSGFSIAQIDGLGSDGVLRPCDSPGSGCRNLSRPAGSTGPGANQLRNPGLTSGGRRSLVP